MTTTESLRADVETVRAALEPVRASLLADAETEAATILREAQAVARGATDDAEREVDAVVDRARRRTERSARARADQDSARVRRDAHRQLLDAQESLRARFVDRVHDAVWGLRLDPRYPALLDALEARARHQLGEDVEIERDSDGGGVVATAEARRVDYGLDALAGMAVEAHSEEVSKLWR